MRFHTKHEAQKIHDEIYECDVCNTTHMSYAMLDHPSEDSGGFCASCGSEQLTVRYLSTVYQQLWLTEKEVNDIGSAMQVADEVGDWEVANFTIKVGEKL